MADNQEVAELSLRVAKLERMVQFLLSQAHLEYRESVESMYLDVTALKRQGKVTEAIQLYRTKTNVGLAEAKIFVDSLTV